MHPARIFRASRRLGASFPSGDLSHLVDLVLFAHLVVGVLCSGPIPALSLRRPISAALGVHAFALWAFVLLDYS